MRTTRIALAHALLMIKAPSVTLDVRLNILVLRHAGVCC